MPDDPPRTNRDWMAPSALRTANLSDERRAGGAAPKSAPVVGRDPVAAQRREASPRGARATGSTGASGLRIAGAGAGNGHRGRPCHYRFRLGDGAAGLTALDKEPRAQEVVQWRRSQ